MKNILLMIDSPLIVPTIFSLIASTKYWFRPADAGLFYGIIIIMINFRNEAELSEILKEFDAPKLVYKGRYDAGPDEELYFFETEDGDKYGIWSRDYMSELKYEANGLKNNYNVKIKRWVMTKDGDETAYYRGDYFALFKM